MRQLIVLLVTLVLVGGCTGEQRTTTSTAASDKSAAAPAPRIAPAEVAGALDSLSNQMQQQVQAAADEMEKLMPSNDTRRRTLRWRIRMAEVCTQARWRDNALAGVIELWFWAIVTERHMSIGEPATYFAAHLERLAERTHGLVVTAEKLVRRCVPPERFDDLKNRILAAAESGDAFVSDQKSSGSPIGGLLEVTKLESLIAIPLSPFSAFEGVKTGGDAAAHLSVVAERAVDLMATYPQVINWQLQAAMVEAQSQDGVAGILREVHQANTSVTELLTTIRAMPAQVRSETVALLEQSRAAQGDVRETLASTTKAAEALEKLTAAIDAVLARIMPPPGTKETEGAGTPSRPFDIREYTAALEATAVAARDLRTTLASAEALIAAPAIPARVAEVDRSLTTLVATIAGWCIAVLIIATGCVVVLVAVVRRTAKRG
jgi:hypothetical protein